MMTAAASAAAAVLARESDEAGFTAVTMAQSADQAIREALAAAASRPPRLGEASIQGEGIPRSIEYKGGGIVGGIGGGWQAGPIDQVLLAGADRLVVDDVVGNVVATAASSCPLVR